MSASPPGLGGGEDLEGRRWAFNVQGPQGQGERAERRGALGTASSFELVWESLATQDGTALGVTPVRC